jgi:hypothetical protein
MTPEMSIVNGEQHEPTLLYLLADVLTERGGTNRRSRGRGTRGGQKGIPRGKSVKIGGAAKAMPCNVSQIRRLSFGSLLDYLATDFFRGEECPASDSAPSLPSKTARQPGLRRGLLRCRQLVIAP